MTSFNQYIYTVLTALSINLGRHMYIITQFDTTRLTEGITITGGRRRLRNYKFILVTCIAKIY